MEEKGKSGNGSDDWAAIAAVLGRLARLSGRPTRRERGRKERQRPNYAAQAGEQADLKAFGPPAAGKLLLLFSLFLFTCFQKYFKYILIQNKINQIHTTQ
jgi:hypothetical protein